MTSPAGAARAQVAADSCTVKMSDTQDADQTRMLRLVAVGDSTGRPGEAAECRSVALFAGFL